MESEKTKNYSELYTAVNSLKEELRLPVILYYIEDFSVKEIAQILEISEGAVQKRLARARGKLSPGDDAGFIVGTTGSKSGSIIVYPRDISSKLILFADETDVVEVRHSDAKLFAGSG